MSEIKIIPARGISLQIKWHDKGVNQSELLNKNPIKPTDKYIPLKGEGGFEEVVDNCLGCYSEGEVLQTVDAQVLLLMLKQIKSQITEGQEDE